MYILTRNGSISLPLSEPHFLKNHELYIALVFFSKMGFWQRKLKSSIFCQIMRLYVTQLHTKNESHSLVSFPDNSCLIEPHLL